MFGWILKTNWNVEKVMDYYRRKGLIRYPSTIEKSDQELPAFLMG